MSATQTITTTTTREWKGGKKNKGNKGNTLAKAYSAQVAKAKATPKQKPQKSNARRRCPTCGRPL